MHFLNNWILIMLSCTVLSWCAVVCGWGQLAKLNYRLVIRAGELGRLMGGHHQTWQYWYSFTPHKQPFWWVWTTIHWEIHSILHIFSLNYFFPVLFLQLLHFQKLSSILKLGVSSIIIVQIVHQCIMSKPPTPRYVQAKN